MNKNELRAVVEKAQNGEKTAFGKLYKEFHEKLYFFVLKNVGDKQTAEDITEDSFLASMDGIGSLKEPEHYETWLHSIAFNKCRMYFRQKGREDNISLDDENLSEDIHADEDSAQERHSKCDYVDHCADQLLFVCKGGDKECKAQCGQ